jgi:hypothetical protein
VKAKHVVDRTIAHDDRRGVEDVTMTHEEMHNAIHVCEDIAKPYIAPFTGRGYNSLTPIEQTRWWRIFDPWMPSEEP